MKTIRTSNPLSVFGQILTKYNRYPLLVAMLVVVMTTNAQVNDDNLLTEDLSEIDLSSKKQINGLVDEVLGNSPNPNDQAKFYLQFGTYLNQNYKYEEADSLLEICTRITIDSTILAEAEYQRGFSLTYRNIRIRALQYFHSALDIFMILEDSLGMGKSLDKIADNHNYIGEHATARPFYDRAILIFTGIADTARLTNVLGNIGGMFSDDGNQDSSLIYYQSAIRLNEQFGALSNLSADLSGVAGSLYETGQIKKALNFYHRSLNVANKGGGDEAKAFANQHLGIYYFDQENYDSAEYYLQITLDFGRKMNYAQLLINSLDLLHQVAFKKNEYELAYDLLTESNQLNDSLLSLENVSLLNSLRTEFELEKRESENQLLTEQSKLRDQIIANQSRMNLVLSIGSILLSFTVLGLWRLNLSRKRKNIKIREQAEKLKELDDFKSKFLANISHDIRSPLSSVKGFADLIKLNEDDLSQETIEFLGYINENVEQLTKMTEEINALIELEQNRFKIKPEPIDVNKFFGTLANMFAAGQSDKSVRFSYESTISDEVVINADKDALQKIIFNVIGNAFKYNTTGTYVSLTVSTKNEWLTIKIMDDGPGIDSENISKIFDRYYRSAKGERLATGHGIGLSITKDLVELHGGNIEVQSIPNKETCFSLTLPLSE